MSGPACAPPSFDFDPAPRCGDGVVQKAEACDDGGNVDGDGCDSTCAWELPGGPDESEPNDDTDHASSSAGGEFLGTINPSGDVDVIRVRIHETPTRLLARIRLPGDGACVAPPGGMLELIDKDGVTVLAAYGGCTLVQVDAEIAAYYLRVSAGSSGAAFPYALDVFVIRVTESEPNDDVLHAEVYKPSFVGTLASLQDADWVSVDVSSSGSLHPYLSPLGLGYCDIGNASITIEVFDEGHVVVATSSPSRCPAVDVPVSFGKYFVRTFGTLAYPYGLGIDTP